MLIRFIQTTVLLCLVLYHSVDAKPGREHYKIDLIKATAIEGDSISQLSIQPDSTAKDKRFHIEHDSVNISWIIDGTSAVEYEVTNGRDVPIWLVFDSMTAVDLRGYLIDLIPSGVKFSSNLRAEPLKLKPGKSYKGGFLEMTRQDSHSGIYNPILPYVIPTSHEAEKQRVRDAAGKSFKYNLAIDRASRFDRYSFTFVIRSADVLTKD